MFLHNREHSALCVLGKGRNGFFNLIAWIIVKTFEVAPRFLSDWLAFSQEICVVWEFGTCNWITHRKHLLLFERMLCPCRKTTSSAASPSLCRGQALPGVPSEDAHPFCCPAWPPAEALPGGSGVLPCPALGKHQRVPALVLNSLERQGMETQAAVWGHAQRKCQSWD